MVSSFKFKSLFQIRAYPDVQYEIWMRCMFSMRYRLYDVPVKEYSSSSHF